LARRIPDEETLKQQVKSLEVERNNWLCHVYDQHRNADWRFTSQDVRIKLRRLYSSLSD